MRIPKVYNLESPRTSKPVANQFVIQTPEGEVFQSYDSVIAFVPNDKERAFYKYNEGSLADNGLDAYPEAYLDTLYWNYSKTTSKYRNQFFNQTTAECRDKINKDEYKLINLNG